ncbi:hypothetical protein CM19_07565 [Candidatus Acidianus copahuensis]|uniref:Uncharacterized protein n=1 Tax=Candidatus Acidianus copahuensis TaxID=1160895 RepID=A0A031LPV3_9CREN|nr:hypothetical protein CM19_07565 [Candidatus Acidianus copahuensis]NON62789.1 hypothetical protein [Acidianus sp. RZ1]
MLDYARRTMESGVEFISFILRNGEYAIFEGEEDKVEIPMPKGVAQVHTHPGICVFSAKDLETADSLFIRGYVTVAVMNPRCLSVIYRRGVYTPEDQEDLKKLMKATSKAKNLDDIKSAYSSFKPPNLIFSNLPV